MCDSAILGGLCRYALRQGCNSLTFPRSADAVLEDAHEFVPKLFTGLKKTIEAFGKGLGLSHDQCYEPLITKLSRPEFWMSEQLANIMQGFPTQGHQDYMASQREKCGLNVNWKYWGPPDSAPGPVGKEDEPN